MLFKRNDVFNMAGMRKHINGLDTLYAIAMFNQEECISLLGFRVAGNVYDAAWRKGTRRT